MSIPDEHAYFLFFQGNPLSSAPLVSEIILSFIITELFSLTTKIKQI